MDVNELFTVDVVLEVHLASSQFWCTCIEFRMCGERLTNQELGYLTLSQQQTEIAQLLRDGELSTESRKILNELENWSQQIAEKFALDDLKNSRL